MFIIAIRSENGKLQEPYKVQVTTDDNGFFSLDSVKLDVVKDEELVRRHEAVRSVYYRSSPMEAWEQMKPNVTYSARSPSNDPSYVKVCIIEATAAVLPMSSAMTAEVDNMIQDEGAREVTISIGNKEVRGGLLPRDPLQVLQRQVDRLTNSVAELQSQVAQLVRERTVKDLMMRRLQLLSYTFTMRASEADPDKMIPCVGCHEENVQSLAPVGHEKCFKLCLRCAAFLVPTVTPDGTAVVHCPQCRQPIASSAEPNGGVALTASTPLASPR